MRDERRVESRLGFLFAVGRADLHQLVAVGIRHDDAINRRIRGCEKSRRSIERIVHQNERVCHLPEGLRKHARSARARRCGPRAGIRPVRRGNVPFDNRQICLRRDARLHVAIRIRIAHGQGRPRAAIEPPVQRGHGTRLVFEVTRNHDRLRACGNLGTVFRVLDERRDIRARDRIRRARSAARRCAFAPILPARIADHWVPQLQRPPAAIGEAHPFQPGVSLRHHLPRAEAPVALVGIAHIVHFVAQRIVDLNLLSPVRELAGPSTNHRAREARVRCVEIRHIRRDHEVAAGRNRRRRGNRETHAFR